MEIINYVNISQLPYPCQGIFDNIPNQVYHSLPGISRSDIVNLNISVKHWLYWKNKKYTSDAMDFGTLVHDIIMFPENIKNYVFELDLPKRSKEEKEIHAKFEEKNMGKMIIGKGATKDDPPEIALKKILENIDKNKFVKQFINSQYCKFEHSVFWIDQATGLQCKCRPDILVKFGDAIFIFDIKTCRDASYNSFRYDLKTHKYNVQASYYSEGVRQVTGAKKIIFGFIAIETTAPYDIAVYDLDEATIQASNPRWQQGLERYKNYIETGIEQGYEQILKTISLKDYEI